MRMHMRVLARSLTIRTYISASVILSYYHVTQNTLIMLQIDSKSVALFDPVLCIGKHKPHALEPYRERNHRRRHHGPRGRASKQQGHMHASAQ